MITEWTKYLYILLKSISKLAETQFIVIFSSDGLALKERRCAYLKTEWDAVNVHPINPDSFSFVFGKCHFYVFMSLLCDNVSLIIYFMCIKCSWYRRFYFVTSQLA